MRVATPARARVVRARRPADPTRVLRFRAMGCDAEVRVLDRRRTAAEVDAVLVAARAELAVLERSWSRFLPDSDLSRLNADPRRVVPVPDRLALALEAAVVAARESGGLVVPTLGGQLVAAGYDRSFALLRGTCDGLAAPGAPDVVAGPPTPTSTPAPTLDRAAGTVTREPGVLLDLGGIGKGLAADLVARRLATAEHAVVSLGGDLVVTGTLGLDQPVTPAHPLTGAPLPPLRLRGGAVATSGTTVRTWRHRGRRAHHLLDPRTGEPADTGVVQVTARAPTGAGAERRAKHALLGGPDALAEVLGEHGGVAVLADGRVVRWQPPDASPPPTCGPSGGQAATQDPEVARGTGDRA